MQLIRSVNHVKSIHLWSSRSWETPECSRKKYEKCCITGVNHRESSFWNVFVIVCFQTRSTVLDVSPWDLQTKPAEKGNCIPFHPLVTFPVLFLVVSPVFTHAQVYFGIEEFFIHLDGGIIICPPEKKQRIVDHKVIQYYLIYVFLQMIQMCYLIYMRATLRKNTRYSPQNS